MGVAAYSRGTRLIAQDAQERARVVAPRVERQAQKDEAARLRERVAELERDLSRARRCIAELRRSKEARLTEAREDSARSAAAISILCRIAFPGDEE